MSLLFYCVGHGEFCSWNTFFSFTLTSSVQGIMAPPTASVPCGTAYLVLPALPLAAFDIVYIAHTHVQWHDHGITATARMTGICRGAAGMTPTASWLVDQTSSCDVQPVLLQEPNAAPTCIVVLVIYARRKWLLAEVSVPILFLVCLLGTAHRVPHTLSSFVILPRH